MKWTKVTKSPSRDDSGNDDAAVLSRRRVLAGIGFAGLFAVAGAKLLASSPAEARNNTPVTEPEAAPTDAAKDDVAERDTPERNLADSERGDATEFSSQRYYYRRRRRYWRRRRRRYWRRRYYYRRRYYRRRYYRRRYYY
jgi:hypothetical protein